MTHIVVTTSTFPIRPDDGIPRFVLDLAQALSERGRVTVLAPDAVGAELIEQIDQVEVRRFGYFRPRSLQRLAITGNRGMRDNLRGSILAKLQVPLFLAAQALQLRKLIRQESVDVVNAHWLVPQGWVAAFVLRKDRRVKLILHVHAGDVYLLQRLSFGGRIARFVVQRADAIFADGSHVRDALDDLLGYSSHAILQPMGVRRGAFAAHSVNSSSVEEVPTSFPDGFVFFFGRLAEKKGTIYLIRAMPLLIEEFPGLGLVIVGYGPEEDALKEEVARLQLEDRVRFEGGRSHEEIIDWLHRCRAVAVPSIIDSRGETEGMPTVVVEALAAGVPVVGSRVNGIPDVIRHAENGWLCEQKDPVDLAEKLTIALSCDRERIGRAAHETAANHDWARVAENYWERIAELLSERPVVSKGGEC